MYSAYFIIARESTTNVVFDRVTIINLVPKIWLMFPRITPSCLNFPSYRFVKDNSSLVRGNRRKWNTKNKWESHGNWHHSKKKVKDFDDDIVIDSGKFLALRSRVERDVLPFSESLISVMTTEILQSPSLIAAGSDLSTFLRSPLMRMLSTNESSFLVLTQFFLIVQERD